MDLRARKQELGITASEDTAPARFSQPTVAVASTKTDEHFSAVSAIATATLQIDNAIQEVSKKSAYNKASLEGLPIVVDDSIDYDPRFDSDTASDNLLFEQPVEALEISDVELDILLSTTAQSQIAATKPALSKKDLLSSLLTQAAYSPPIKSPPKTTPNINAAATVSPSPGVQNTKEVLSLPPNTSPDDDEFEFEFSLAPEPEHIMNTQAAHTTEIEAWEVETSPEVIEKFKSITANFNSDEFEKLLDLIEELTGFNLPDMYPEILERSCKAADASAQDGSEPPELPPTQIEETEVAVESALEPVKAEPDFAALWTDTISANHTRITNGEELDALDLLAEPDSRFIKPLFERLVDKDEFNPNAPRPATLASVARRHVENSELQSALMKFVEAEEDSSQTESHPVPEVWNDELPIEFGNSTENRMSLLIAGGIGVLICLAAVFFSQSEDSFSSVNLLIAIFSTGASSLMAYASLSFCFRIVFWVALSYPVVKIIRERITA